MDYPSRVAELAALVETVDGSGIVHDRRRNTPQWEKFILFFKSSEGIINGWQLSRRGPSKTNVQRWGETYQLDKLMGIRDDGASEHLFQQNLDDVGRLFVQGRDLSFGTVAEGFDITEIDERMFGGVLCHWAACLITVSFYTIDL
jgi:hypothetical protein